MNARYYDFGSIANFVQSVLNVPRLYLKLALSCLLILVLSFAAQQLRTGRDLRNTSLLFGSPGPPFTGAFARFPRVSELLQRHRIMTIIGAWNDDDFPAYLGHLT